MLRQTGGRAREDHGVGGPPANQTRPNPTRAKRESRNPVQPCSGAPQARSIQRLTRSLPLAPPPPARSLLLSLLLRGSHAPREMAADEEVRVVAAPRGLAYSTQDKMKRTKAVGCKAWHPIGLIHRRGCDFLAVVCAWSHPPRDRTGRRCGRTHTHTAIKQAHPVPRRGC